MLESKFPLIKVIISGKNAPDPHSFFSILDVYAEQRYGTYRDYDIHWNKDHCIAHYYFNNEYDSKKFLKHVDKQKHALIV